MLINQIKKRTQQYQAKSLARHRNITHKRNPQKNHIYINGKCCIDFSSNDYLSLGAHQKIKSSFQRAAKRYGVGSGSAAFVSGYSHECQKLEEQFSHWMQVDQAVMFNSGYHANIGVISALANRSSTVLSDKLCHASLLDGILLSRCKHYRYAHNNASHLRDLATQKKADLVITESIFSMEGDIAPIKEILNITRQLRSSLIIDDAHGIGIIGQHGRGIFEKEQLQQSDVLALILPLGKAFHGLGAMVVGRQEIISSIMQWAKSYRYSTMLPAAIYVALQSSLTVINEEPWRREQLASNIRFFLEYAADKAIPLSSTDITPIKSVLVGNSKTTLAAHDYLLSQQIFLPAILPPTVPPHKARLRVSLNTLHTEQQISYLLDHICKALHAN